ncbi:AraC family transcriptional regulator [Kordiimonas sediminis]|uniref:AraC family transcriptional regulator n=1 Tax=Kordiimonas sediminis TaxID=1735581 RepID=A0A919ATJ8_9PROT|nr:AraC family transcriptional regulator [Kordiimonas sediminis]GHF24923.1 AraC family transcriptional regulator [Kordiimonas sediminis]
MFLHGVPVAARELGIDVYPILRKVGLPSRTLTVDIRIDYCKLIEFLEQIAETHGADHIGFLAGKYRPVLKMGVYGQLLSLSSNLQEAMRLVEEFIALLSPIVQWRMQKSGGIVSIIRHDRVPHPPKSGQFRSSTITHVFNLLRTLIGGDWRPLSVSLSHARPKSWRAMEQHFKVPLGFDQDFDGITIMEEDLYRPLQMANPELLETVKAHASTLKAQIEPNFDLMTQVRLVVQENLAHGKVQKEQVAERMHMHPKALQRRLHAQGISFKQLLTEVRMEIAIHYLNSSSISVLQLSQLLGYSSAEAFSRAFKNIHGMSPKLWVQSVGTHTENKLHKAG